jgi:hypothetical protein
MELFKPAKSKRKTKTPKRLSNNPTEMELQHLINQRNVFSYRRK